ncbi:MAG: hypothetical protein JXR70_08105 [Spirochaetales bacterium]|nr:hypothetical protein [Spirochaetales bacterium]
MFFFKKTQTTTAPRFFSGAVVRSLGGAAEQSDPKIPEGFRETPNIHSEINGLRL